jgi:thiol-disulfide isomerase/thioredoxin
MNDLLKTLKNLTLTKKIVLFFFIIFILLLGYSFYNKNQLLSLQQNKESVIENYENKSLKFSMYYVDWCPHCKSSKPEFIKLKNNHKKINNRSINYNMIDCEKYPKLAEQADVESYPTFILSDTTKYEGERNLNGFLDFLNSHS